jgi:hypothetical protein
LVGVVTVIDNNNFLGFVAVLGGVKIVLVVIVVVSRRDNFLIAWGIEAKVLIGYALLLLFAGLGLGIKVDYAIFGVIDDRVLGGVVVLVGHGQNSGLVKGLVLVLVNLVVGGNSGLLALL